MRERYGLYNLETDRVSEATWATYKGAMKRCGPKEVVVLVEPSNDVIIEDDLYDRVDEMVALKRRMRKLESINADLYEALRDAMRSARKDFATKEEFEAAYPEQVAALVKARGEERAAAMSEDINDYLKDGESPLADAERRIELLEEWIRYQDEKHTECANNLVAAKEHIHELEEVLQEAIGANPFSRPGWVNRARTLLEPPR